MPFIPKPSSVTVCNGELLEKVKEQLSKLAFAFVEASVTIYAEHDWCWSDGVPTENDLLFATRDLIASLQPGTCSYASFGRIVVMYQVYTTAVQFDLLLSPL